MSKKRILGYMIYHPDVNIISKYVTSEGYTATISSNYHIRHSIKAAFRLAYKLGKGAYVERRTISPSGKRKRKAWSIV